MREIAYLFERFPSFGQTFCYREVAELERQGLPVRTFSIRQPGEEPPESWDPDLAGRVHYLPQEKDLVAEIDRALKKPAGSDGAREAIKSWGRQPDFLRLYQAVYVGLRMQEAGLRHVHAHFAGMAARTVYWIGQFFPFTYSFTAHANDIFAPRVFAISLEKLVSNASAVVTVSDYSKRLLREQFPESGDKIRRVYNGIDPSGFPPRESGDGVPNLISVGRLIEKKGFADLIDACAILKAEGREFHCSIVGEGPLEDALRGRITAAGLNQHLELTGPLSQTQIARRLARATVFALPCVREADGAMDNLPTVIMEAMAAGLPVISTPLGGIPEMVESGVTGELVPEHDPAALASAIRRLMDNPEVGRQLGERGRAVAREKFSIQTSARELQNIFAEVPQTAT